jgi:CubicO group peptidase (beta-lactamase class C family)
VDLDSDGVIRVRHLLNHTSEGVPGSEHHYSGQRYLELDKVIEGASGRTLAELLVERIIEPLGLRHTAPSIWDTEDFAVTRYDAQEFYGNMARGYRLDGSAIVPERHPEIFCSSAGLLSSVRDVASFSIALDQGRLLDPETRELMLTRTVSNSGQPFTYGLGWYVQYHRGLKLARLFMKAFVFGNQPLPD